MDERFDQETGPLRSPSRSRGRRGWLRPRIWLPPLVAFGLLAVGWQLYAAHNHEVIPTIPAIFDELTGDPGLYAQNAGVTLQEMVVGGACGMVAAFVLAVVMAEVPVLARALMPIAVALNVTPIVAIAPGLVVAFGFGMAPKYIVTAVIVFFPFLINALIGLRSVDPDALDVLSTMHASRPDVLWRLRLPGSLPFLFAGARICLPLSVIGAVVAEFSAAGKARGLGSLIETAASLSDLRTVYAAIVVLAAIGIVVTLLVVLLQRVLLRWHPSGGRRFS